MLKDDFIDQEITEVKAKTLQQMIELLDQRAAI